MVSGTPFVPGGVSNHPGLYEGGFALKPIAERFWSKVNKDGPVPPSRPELGPCWVWTDRPHDSGYGVFWVERLSTRSHRWSYEQAKGLIPSHLEIDHLCRNRACVNPDHLEAVTRRINQRRGEGFAGKHARLTHCPRGHPYDETNTYHPRNTDHRVCRACHRWHEYNHAVERRLARPKKAAPLTRAERDSRYRARKKAGLVPNENRRTK